MKASDLFVKCLENEGVEYIFGVPGEENEDIMMSLINSKIKFIPTRHEQGAAFTAAIYGRLTGKAGVCLATLGPGAMNLTTGLAEAKLGNMPVVAITGQGGLHRFNKENFQFVDVVGAFKPLTKWSASITTASIIEEVVRKAFKIAEMERPGVTHLELPEDIAKHETDGKPFPRIKVRRPSADGKAIDQAVEMIKKAKNPLILSGNGCVRTRVSKQLNAFVEERGIPIVHTQMGKGAVSDKSEYSLFTTGINTKDYYVCGFDKSDLIITLGYNVVEFSPNHWNRKKDKKILHIDFVPSEVDEYYNPDLEVIGDVSNTLWVLRERLSKEAKKNPEYFFKLRKEIIKDHKEKENDPGFPLKPQRIIHEIREALDDNDIVISDVGMHKVWTARMYKTYAPNTCLIDNGLCSMGIALPGAIGAKLSRPEQKVVAVCGDGGFLMNCQEIETAIRLGLGFVIVIFTDSKYGMIEWKQQMHHKKSFGIHFTNPDFLKFADSFGAKGYKVEKAEDFSKMLADALKQRTVSIIDVPVDYSENLALVKKLGQEICPV
ncbi:acetolactate synthase [Candidatus Woesearchaeota archaeon]|jgi:acetolactate synthase-1/2/3 large subunit|nr:acetolactate synthase [Candidatus Woesearchaeota archaeon]|tara:strand:+ start:19458 stop:21098 length:1641 start_codon:yes stop_codon:yes gene_type:complete